MKKQDKSHFFVKDIKVSGLNNTLYDNFGVSNDDDNALLWSISKIGIQEPLVISSDHFLLSGHRRLSACKYLGLIGVPVRILEIEFGAMSLNQKIKQLRVFNQQRDKTPAEKIRERLVDIEPKAAKDLLIRLDQQRKKLRPVKVNVDLGLKRKRAKITTQQFLSSIQEIIDTNQQYWPLSDRRIHYLLLNNPPLRHDKKPNSRYRNDLASYKALTSVLTRARLSREIPMESIEDSTRPIQLGGGFDNFQSFIAQETQNFLLGFSRNRQIGQPYHIEIMLEKNALRTIIEAVAREYCVPVTTGRGYASLAPRYALAERFRDSGKSQLVLLLLTDFDPDGEQIAASFARSLRDDFGILNIHPVKVALTAEDVKQYDLPSDMDAKP